MHRDLDLLERAQQALQTVRQADGRGRIREQERSHDQKRDAQHHRDGSAHALDRNAEDPKMAQLRAGGAKEVQKRRERDNEQHRL